MVGQPNNDLIASPTPGELHSVASEPKTAGKRLGDNYLLFFVFAALVPCLIAFVNYYVFPLRATQAWMAYQPKAAIFIQSIYIVQIAALGYGVGKFVEHPILRWGIFIWCIAFINLLLGIQASYIIGHYYFYVWSSSKPFFAASLFFAMMSGEMGMIMVWAILGNTKWVWRLPATIIALGFMFYAFNLGGDLAQTFMIVILLCQTSATFCFCGLLWIFGYRIESISADQQTDDSAARQVVRRWFRMGARQATTHVLPSGKRMQFSMWHMFIWMTVLGPFLAVVRLIDWTSLRYLGLSSIATYVSLGTAFAIISLVALWAALGREATYIRFFGLILFSLLAGAAIGVAGKWGWWDLISRQRISQLDGVMDMWIIWTFLAAFFLAAMLMFFRGSGLRLVQVFVQNPKESIDTQL